MKFVNVAGLVRWILEHATASDDGAALLDGYGEALVAAGLPIRRISVSIPAIDPTVRGFNFNWRCGEGSRTVPNAHGPEGEAAFRQSPVYALVENRRTFARWRLDGSAEDATYPLLEHLRTEGVTDYVVHLIGFAPGTRLIGVAVSFATDRAGGFNDDELALLAETLPAVGLAACKLGLAGTLRGTLATYLGSATSARVLQGQITRGQGQTVAAAILLVDLRAFTALTDRDDAVRVVGWLDEHFDTLGEPIARCGGEILKFMGDGFLAVFPVQDPEAQPCAVCEGALSAARLAVAANTALNDKRRAAGAPALEADLVLHFGEVVYGNVGTSRRLDFTVIGRAVNEASRIEKLCDELGRSLLLSDTFAARCGGPLTLLGTYPLRGLDQPRRIWTVPD